MSKPKEYPHVSVVTVYTSRFHIQQPYVSSTEYVFFTNNKVRLLPFDDLTDWIF